MPIVNKVIGSLSELNDLRQPTNAYKLPNDPRFAIRIGLANEAAAANAFLRLIRGCARTQSSEESKPTGFSLLQKRLLECRVLRLSRIQGKISAVTWRWRQNGMPVMMPDNSETGDRVSISKTKLIEETPSSPLRTVKSRR